MYSKKSLQNLFLTLITFAALSSQAQISFSTIGTAKTENFNTLTNSGTSITWSDNTTLAGFYVSPTTVRIEASTSSMDNAGAPYIIANGTDRSLGSRASGTSPNNNIYFGARFVNNTSSIIKSLEVSYYGEQWSIAENGSNVNKLSFSYQKSSSTITSLTSGSWTNNTSLDFSQIKSCHTTSGCNSSNTSAQYSALDGNNSANRVLKYAVFNVTLNPNEEIMLRWYDLNDAANDHHLQIDELSVTPWDVVASVVLPIELTEFKANCNSKLINLEWTTKSERDNAFFTIESTLDGKYFSELKRIDGAGNSSSELNYSIQVENKNTSQQYFRLKQTDFNGKATYSEIIALKCKNDATEIQVFPNPSEGKFYILGLEEKTQLEIFNQLGQKIQDFSIEKSGNQFELNDLRQGIYFVRINQNDVFETHKIVKN
ncbi:MAG: T9SS type A sorting domain-containing protein [Bacteroidota bacterium]